MKFNVFHYLLYSKRMNTLNKHRWSKCARGKDTFVKKGLFLQGTPTADLRMKKRRHGHEPWALHKPLFFFLHPGFSFTVTALQLPASPNTPSLTSNGTDAFAASSCHSWGVLKNMFVYKVTLSKLHGSHCTLFKPLLSGIGATVPEERVSPSVSRQQIKLSQLWMCRHSSQRIFCHQCCCMMEKISYIWNQ